MRLRFWAPPAPRGLRIERIVRVVADLARAEAFHRNALGFRRVSSTHDARTTLLALGDEQVELTRPPAAGLPYPAGSRSDDLWFQHLAIVVSDMDAAYRHLSAHDGWRPISEGGPQTLPPSSGDVRAFKFRDPDGHPLELIWFPPGQGRPAWQRRDGGLFLGIDHSAIAVADPARSLRFYRGLGFRVSARSLNEGPVQERLDGLPGARASVTGLRLRGAAGPGLELFGYMPPGRAAQVDDADAAADTVVIRASVAAPRLLCDPDGHRMLLTA